MAQNRSRFGQLLGAINSVAGATRGLQTLVRSELKKLPTGANDLLSGFFLHLQRHSVDVAKQQRKIIPFGLADGDLETQLRTIIGRFGDEDAVMDRSLRQVLGWDNDQKVEDLPGDLTRLAEAARITDPANPQYAALRDPKNPNKVCDVDPKDKQYSLFDAIMLGIFGRYWMVAVKALDFRNKVIFGLSFSVKEGMVSREDITKQMGELGVWGDGMSKYVEYPDKLEDGSENPETEVVINEIVPLIDMGNQRAYLYRDYKFKQRFIVRENRIRQVFEAMKRLGMNMPIPLGGEAIYKILMKQDLTEADRNQYVRSLQRDAYKRFLVLLFTWTEKAKQGKGWGETPQIVWMGFEAIWGGVNYNQTKSDVLHALLDVADYFALGKSRDRKMVRGDYGRKDAISLLDKGLFSHLEEEIDLPSNWGRLSEEERRLFHTWNPTRTDKEAEILREADMFELRKIALRFNAMLPLEGRDVASLIAGGAGWGWYKQNGNPAPDEFGRMLGALAQHIGERNWLAKIERQRVLATYDPSDEKQRDAIRKAYEEGDIPVGFFNRDGVAEIKLEAKRLENLSSVVTEAFPDRLEEIFGEMAKEIG